MRVLVDARILGSGRPTGVERALRTLLLGFTRLDGDHEIRMAGRGRLRTASRDAADVFLSPVTAVPPFGPLPRIATVHDLPWVSGARSSRREWRQRLRLAITRRVASRILVPSRATRDALARVPGACPPVDVIPLGLHPDAIGPVDDEARWSVDGLVEGLSSPLLLHVGAPRRRKSPRTLLDAFAAVRRRRPASLVLVGPGTERFAGLDGVRPLGFVADPVLRALYDRADLLLHAADVEGCGLTVLEALARGLPVVASASAAVLESAGDAARTAPAGDAAALAGRVLEVLDDVALHEDLIARGRERVRTRTPEAQASAVLRVCREVLGEGA